MGPHRPQVRVGVIIGMAVAGTRRAGLRLVASCCVGASSTTFARGAP